MKLEITKQIHLEWLNCVALINDEGDNFLVYFHKEIGKAIYGDNLQKALDFIYEKEFTATLEDLEQFEINY
jgi:hypothetical protein